MVTQSPQCDTPSWPAAACVRPNTSSASPAVLVMTPGMSRRRRTLAPLAGRVATSAMGARTSTAAPMGTLTNSTQRHEA